MASGRAPRERGLREARGVPVISDSSSPSSSEGEEADAALAPSVVDSGLSSGDDVGPLSGVRLQKFLARLQSERRANRQLRKEVGAKSKEVSRLLARANEAEELEMQNARLEEMAKAQNAREGELLGEVQRLRREVGEHEAVALGPQRSSVAAGIGGARATSDFNSDAWKERLEQALDEAHSELSQASLDRDQARARAEELEAEARRKDLEAAHLRHLLQCQEAESLKLRADLHERVQIAAARAQRLESPPPTARAARRPSLGREALFPGSLAEELELDAEGSDSAGEPEGATSAQRAPEGLPAAYEAQLMSLEDHLSRAEAKLGATKAAQLQQSGQARAQSAQLARLGERLRESEAALARAEAALAARSEALLAEQSSLLAARGQVARLQAELAEARSQLATQEALDQTASGRVQAAEAALTRAEAALSELQGTLLTARAQGLEQSDATKAEVAALEADLVEARSRLAVQEDSLRAASERAQVAEAALARSEASLAEQVTAQERALERSEAALAEQSSLLVAGLHAELTDARSRLAAQEAVDQAAADRSQATEAALARSEAALAELQGSLLAAREQALEQSSQAAKAQVAALEADLLETRSRLAIQEAASERAQVAEAALARSEAALAEQVTAREQALEQSRAARQQSAGLQAELAEARSRLAIQEAASERAQVAEAALARSEAALAEQVTAREQALEQSRAAREQSAGLQAELAEARSRLAIREAASDRAQAAEAALARSEAALAEQVTAREQALEQSRAAREQSAGLQAELAEARSRLAVQAAASDRAQAAEAALARSEAALVVLQDSLQTAQGQALEQSHAAQAKALQLEQTLTRERRRADELAAQLARSTEAAARAGPAALGEPLPVSGVLWDGSGEQRAKLQRQISRLRLKVPRAAAGKAPFRDSPLAGLAEMLDRVTELSGLPPPRGG